VDARGAVNKPDVRGTRRTVLELGPTQNAYAWPVKVYASK